jgi:response regulator of citrate/malate metabolism
MDIVMPEADSIELLRYLAERGCRSRVVVMSGHNESYLRNAQSIGEGLGLGDVAGLVKPLRVETLRSALQGPA